MDARRILAPLALAALCVLPACGRPTDAADPGPDTRLVYYNTEPGEPARLLVADVAVEVAADAKDELSWVISRRSGSTSMLIRSNPGLSDEDQRAVLSGEDRGTLFWLVGDRLRIVDGAFRIGERDYGSVAPGDRVVVDAASVSVNGVVRGGRD